MIKRYGLPYQGSKNKIAEWVIDNLPYADTFCDLFFGGGAITHRALLSGKYKNFIANDIDGRMIKLFLECCNGEHTIESHPEWISRDIFKKVMYDDIYTTLVWSFGNNCIGYVYGKDIEKMKRALHYACFYNDYKPIRSLGLNKYTDY